MGEVLGELVPELLERLLPVMGLLLEIGVDLENSLIKGLEHFRRHKLTVSPNQSEFIVHISFKPSKLLTSLAQLFSSLRSQATIPVHYKGIDCIDLCLQVIV